eukprot:m.66601 g.66601  ORF g.66601 m.66601 type:complete len:90 (+) comp49897_c0_seq3:20-289(+)
MSFDCRVHLVCHPRPFLSAWSNCAFVRSQVHIRRAKEAQKLQEEQAAQRQQAEEERAYQSWLATQRQAAPTAPVTFVPPRFGRRRVAWD